MIKGRKYILITLIPGVNRFSRRHCMTYLGDNDSGEHQFDARPVAGTQGLEPGWILAKEEAPADAEHYVNRRSGR